MNHKALSFMKSMKREHMKLRSMKTSLVKPCFHKHMYRTGHYCSGWVYPFF